MLVWYGYSWIAPDLFSDLFRYVSRQPMPVIHGTIPNFQYQGSSAKWIESTSSQTFAACIIFYVSGNSQECEFHACLLQKKNYQKANMLLTWKTKVYVYMIIYSHKFVLRYQFYFSECIKSSNHDSMQTCIKGGKASMASERSSKHNSAGSCFTHRYIEMWLPKKRESDSKMYYVILFYIVT